LFQYIIGALLITAEITFQQIREKEEPEDGKHDKKLEQDNSPEIPAPGHLPETIVIEFEDFLEH
jgi:hypothetical protein